MRFVLDHIVPDAAVRRWLWDQALLPQAGDGTTLNKLPDRVRELLLTALAPAA